MIDLENSMILEFSLDKQTLKRADDFHPVEKSEVYLQMHFTFDKDWDNTKRHVFFQYRNEKVYEQILTSDSCYVPIEVIKKYGFYVWLIGYDIATGEVKIPTNQLRVNVYEGSEEETGETTYVTDIVSDTITFEKSGNVYKAEIPNKYVTGIRYDEKTGIIEFLGRTENGIEKVISVIDLPIDKGTLGYDDTEIKKAIEKLQKEKANASEVLDENEIKSLIDENVPKKTSQLENDNQFINRVVDDLVNYYKKTETYTKTEINNLISAIPKFNILVVESLPTSDISLTTVYLLKENEDGGNLYTEYIYANGSWEILGSQKIDLTGYVKQSDIVITNENGTTKAVGGISAGTILTGKNVLQVLEDILYPYVAFGISVDSISPSTSVYEKGTTVTITGVKVKITNGSRSITNLKLYDSSSKTNLLGEKTSGISTSNTFTISRAVTSSTSFYAEATDGVKTIGDSTSFLSFYYPTFYGVLDTGYSLTSGLITGKTKVLKANKNNTFTYTATNQHPFVAFPASYGNLTSIKDSSNLEYIGDFVKTTMNLNVTGGTVSYNIYVLKDPTDISNYKFIFS